MTSRQALRVAGEQEQVVRPLITPPTGASDDEISASPAVQLFAARARDVHAGFAVTPDNAETVAELCRRLDGLPLALELAAARVRLLRPAMLLRRLHDHLDLGSGRRDLPPRQQTLRATIDWSYSLLDERERVTFARLAVFSGGATLQAAERVCATGDDDVLEPLAGTTPSTDPPSRSRHCRLRRRQPPKLPQCDPRSHWRLQQRTGAAEFSRRDIVAEVQDRATGVGFERQTIYRCLRRLTSHEPGSVHRDLEDLGNDRLRRRSD